MSGNDLQRRRGDLGMSQAALARRIGMHVRTISKWERGINPVPGWIGIVLSAVEDERRRAAAGARPAE